MLLVSFAHKLKTTQLYKVFLHYSLMKIAEIIPHGMIAV